MKASSTVKGSGKQGWSGGRKPLPDEQRRKRLVVFVTDQERAEMLKLLERLRERG